MTIASAMLWGGALYVLSMVFMQVERWLLQIDYCEDISSNERAALRGGWMLLCAAMLGLFVKFAIVAQSAPLDAGH